jgi:hypothetical protein
MDYDEMDDYKMDEFVSKHGHKIRYYAARVKALIEKMTQQIASGAEPEGAALSLRDFGILTGADEKNEDHTFFLAWDAYRFVHRLNSIICRHRNGETYLKYFPLEDY